MSPDILTSLQLSGADVRPGLQQGLLPAPVSLDQDAGPVRPEAGGLPARPPVRQAGNTDLKYWSRLEMYILRFGRVGGQYTTSEKERYDMSNPR